MLPENALEDVRLNEDTHELNKEIVRLTYFLNVDLERVDAVDELLKTNLPDDHEHFYKLATLKGLILLRSHIHQLRAEQGIPDAKGPLEEEIFQTLNFGHHHLEEQ